MPRPRVLVLGATGFLGAFAVAALRRCADVVTGGRRGADVAVDLADAAVASTVAGVVAAVAADRVLNLAALSRIADCGREPALAHAVNARAPGELAMALGPRLLHVSTDLVFDGRAAPYAALDPVAPLSVYGQTKAEGEELALARGARVVRLPLLFGPDAQGRGATAMLRVAIAAGRPQALFTNEYRTPLHAADAARVLAELVRQDALPRIVHIAGPERVSRWELGQRFCRIHGLSASGLEPMECQDAMRPRDVSLRGVLPQRTLAEMLADS